MTAPANEPSRAAAPWSELVDNPILTKFYRIRLQRSGIVGSAAAILAIGLLLAFGTGTGESRGMLYAGLIVIAGLEAFGGVRIATALGEARTTGILDFYRIAPFSIRGYVLGFLGGPPVREHVLALMLLPIVFFLGARADLPPQTLLGALLSLAIMMLFLHAVAVFGGLVARDPRSAVGIPFGIAFVLAQLDVALATVDRGGFTPVSALLAALAPGEDKLMPCTLFGVALWPWVKGLIVLAPLGAFALLGAARRLAREDAAVLSKSQATGLVLVVGVMGLGCTWSAGFDGVTQRGVLILPMLVAVVLAISLAPTRATLLSAAVAHRGGRGPRPLDDETPTSWTLMPLLVGVVLLLGVAVWLHSQMGPVPQGGVAQMARSGQLIARSVALMALTVAEFTLAAQLFELGRRPGTRRTNVGLFVFFTWILPTLVGVVVGTVNRDPMLIGGIMGLSPLAAIGAQLIPGADYEAARDLTLVVAAARAAVGLVAFGALLMRQMRAIEQGAAAELPSVG